jgi:hypothetical protein
MRRSLRRPILPNGVADLAIQIALLAAMLFLYRISRAVADSPASTAEAFRNGRDVIHAEQWLGIFNEASIQHWVLQHDPLNSILSWVYLNAQTTLTFLCLFWLYLFHHERYPFVRNMFFVSFAVAIVGYVALPTAPPRLMGAHYGFVDSVAQFKGTEKFVWNNLANPYAAMPSMHVGFALMIGWSIASVVKHWWVRALWIAYPAGILFVVVATGNHFYLDAVGGAVAASIGALSALALGRLRPTSWAWTPPQSAPQRATT